MNEKINEILLEWKGKTLSGNEQFREELERSLRSVALSALDEAENGLPEEIAIPSTTYDQEEFQAKLEYQGFNTCLKETKQLISRLRSSSGE